MAATVLTAVLAALVVARSAARVRPTEALREASAELTRVGGGCLVTGGVLLALAVSVLGLGLGYRTDFMTLVGLANSLVLVLVIAAAVLGPLITRAAMALLAPLLVCTGATGWLAAANFLARAARTAAAVTPLLLAVSFAATVVFTQTTQLQQAADETRSVTLADQVVNAPLGMSPDLVERTAHLPGVKAATGVVRSQGRRCGHAAGRGGDRLPERPGPETLRPDRHRRPGRPGRRPVRPGPKLYGRGLGFADPTFDHDLLLSHTTTHRSVGRSGRSPGPHPNCPPAQNYAGTTSSGTLAADAQVEEQRALAWVNCVVDGVIIAYTALTVVSTQG
ncbi:hypothetical protein ACFW6E_45485 [Streptomyces olivaceoviridis]|uniref:hypothetical protein n=1 Tax=Streptomyces olivaceoviridis TaxID=1921 RepID=UPI0036CD9A4B